MPPSSRKTVSNPCASRNAEAFSQRITPCTEHCHRSPTIPTKLSGREVRKFAEVRRVGALGAPEGADVGLVLVAYVEHEHIGVGDQPVPGFGIDARCHGCRWVEWSVEGHDFRALAHLQPLKDHVVGRRGGPLHVHAGKVAADHIDQGGTASRKGGVDSLRRKQNRSAQRTCRTGRLERVAQGTDVVNGMEAVERGYPSPRPGSGQLGQVRLPSPPRQGGDIGVLPKRSCQSTAV